MAAGSAKPIVPRPPERDVRVGPTEAGVARQPHLVLAHVRDEVGIVVVSSPRRCDDVVGGEQAVRQAPEPCQLTPSESARHSASCAK